MSTTLGARLKGRIKRFMPHGAERCTLHDLRELIENQRRLVAEVDGLRHAVRLLQYQATVAPDGLPIPPPELHALVSGTDGLDAGAFLDVGRSCANGIRFLLGRANTRLEEFRAVLDFGCGCGRIIRNFHELRGPQLHGTDYNPRLVGWCSENLPFGKFEVNGLEPPLPYTDESFDFVYAFSVFTHFSASLQAAWMAEMQRVLASGGYLLITTHGQAYADFYLNGAERRRFERGEVVVLAKADPGENPYNVFHPIAYVREKLSRGFELIDSAPGQVIDPDRRLISQDAHLLRKRA